MTLALSPSMPAPLHVVPRPPLEEGELREVKVKLPVEQILRLHYARMKKRENFSQIVSSALSRYFNEFSSP
ncbi:MAG: hypothetical protein QOI63_274 [Thermoplasmata archaeon]|jgi:hypothetical protein|nr:hypothetical protein [Thermoplasmata archaeon]